MEYQKVDIEAMYKCVGRFRSLGTGRDFRKVLVGDSVDARTSTLYFVGNIYHNWPSWKRLTIKTDDRLKILDIPTPTINGKPAYIFFWNDLTADLWYRQIERKKLLDWLETAKLEDAIAMGQLILEETGTAYRITADPIFGQWYGQWQVRQIQIEIMRLGLPALRRLNGLIEMDSQNAVGPAVAA